MERELWLSRDDTISGHYNVHMKEEEIDLHGIYHQYIAFFKAKEFHSVFPGQNIRKGCRKRIKRILIELEK